MVLHGQRYQFLRQVKLGTSKALLLNIFGGFVYNYMISICLTLSQVQCNGLAAGKKTDNKFNKLSMALQLKQIYLAFPHMWNDIFVPSSLQISKCAGSNRHQFLAGYRNVKFPSLKFLFKSVLSREDAS